MGFNLNPLLSKDIESIVASGEVGSADLQRLAVSGLDKLIRHSKGILCGITKHEAYALFTSIHIMATVMNVDWPASKDDLDISPPAGGIGGYATVYKQEDTIWGINGQLQA